MKIKSICFVLGLTALHAIANAEDSRPLSAGQLNYMLQCQGCHKANGGGIDGSVPDLSTYGRQLLAVPEGRKYFVSVPGSANAPLSDQELAEVLNHIISDILENQNGENDSLPKFDAEEVTRYRSNKIPDVKRLRAELISAVSETPDNTE